MIRAVSCLAVLLSFANSAHADVELPSVFGDHLVLQRDRSAPVWGRAEPGEQVSIKFAGHVAVTQADENGRWSISLPGQPANSEPHDLIIRGHNEIVVSDVLVGEVWVCSGQSNMEWTVDASHDAANERTGAKHPRIRLFKAAHTLTNEPQFTVAGKWSVCDPSTVGAYSAIAYFFGRDLLQNLDVPIGLISTNWGGSRAEPWTSPEALASHPLWAETMSQMNQDIIAFNSSDPTARERRYQEKLKAFSASAEGYWKSVTAKDPGQKGSWMAPGHDDSGWKTIQAPGVWEDAGVGLDQHDGLVWFRHTVDVPAAWEGKELKLRLGPIDDSDHTFFDGVSAGSIVAQWTAHREYHLPAERVKAGPRVIAVLTYDTGGGGGFAGNPADMTIAPVDGSAEPISLAGEWRWKAGGPPNPTPAPNAPQRDVEPGKGYSSPAAMYNAMIHPFVPYAIQGALWYQGESNAGEADRYRELLPLMIRSWRTAWGQGDFPFGVVQLASFYAQAPAEPVQGGWAFLREAQLHTALTVPRCGLAVATDIGDARDIHPRNKQEVGRRLALWARATVYGESKLEYSGPVYREHRIQDQEVVLHFDHATGLGSRDGEALRGFAIGDFNGHFVWGNARIEGETVVVSSPDIPFPTAVRYGWCNNPEATNLVNAAGLPATPFRTDDPGVAGTPR